MKFSIKSLFAFLTVASLLLALFIYETTSQQPQDFSYRINVEVIEHPEHETLVSYVTLETSDLIPKFNNLLRQQYQFGQPGQETALTGFAVDDFSVRIPVSILVSPILKRKIESIENDDCILFLMENEFGSSIAWRSKKNHWKNGDTVTLDVQSLIENDGFARWANHSAETLDFDWLNR